VARRLSALEAIVLGIVQGLTEFLPISSTAHLRIVPAFVGWEDPGAAFTAVVQLGTMAAVLLFFRRDLWAIAREFLLGLRRPEHRSTLEFRIGVLIIIGTIPIGIFGLIFKDQIEIGEGGGAGAVPTAIATLAAFIVGYASIAFLLRYLASHSTLVFVVYRVVVGALVLALAGAGAIS
jgi:undecaprenyl pyrophosphate phosphatase UppP